MPALEISLLESLNEDFTKYPVFIETGTYIGDTIFAMEPRFKHLYTVELSQQLHYSVKTRYNGNKITFLHGDSSEVFKTLLPSIAEPAIFFLDGHFSQGITAQGEKDCPLVEEINLINSLFKNEAIIIIDDFRLFGKKLDEDWSDINKNDLFEIIKERIIDVYHRPSWVAPDDRLIIHIKAKI
jgi:hypothetical protein